MARVMSERGRAEQQKDQNNPHHDRITFSQKLRFCAAAPFFGSMFTGLRRGPEPAPPARPRWCDKIPTRAENQLYPYSEHSCAHRHSHDSGKLLVIEGVESPKTRSCYEYPPLGRSKKVRTAVGRQICAAGARTLVQKSDHEKQGQQLGARAKAKRKTRRVEPAGLRICPSGVSAGPKPRAPGRYRLSRLA